MKKYNKILLACFILLQVFLLTSCGSGNDSSNNPPPNNPTPTSLDVELITPSNASSGVSLKPNIRLKFSLPVVIDEETISLHENTPSGNKVQLFYYINGQESTMLMKELKSTKLIPGFRDITFVPESTLNINTKYYLVIESNLVSNYGVTLNKQVAYNFTTVKNFALSVSTESRVNICSVSDTTSKLFDCTPTDLLYSNGSSIKFSPDYKRVYITQTSLNKILNCSISRNGQLTNCNDTTGINAPSDIAFGPKGNMAYITGYYNSTITRCSTDGEAGKLIKCTVLDGHFSFNGSKLYSIIFNPSYTYVYVTTDHTAYNYIYKCEYDEIYSDINNCMPAASNENFTTPARITFNSYNNTALITDYGSNDVKLCDAESTGQIINCQSTLNGNFNQPYGIALNADNTYAYITNNDSISTCKINLTNNTLANCDITANAPYVARPYDIVIYNPTIK